MKKLNKKHRVSNRAWMYCRQLAAQLLFCRWSQSARVHVCRVMATLDGGRRNDIFRLLSGYLEHVDRAGEAAAEFLELYADLAKTASPDAELGTVLIFSVEKFQKNPKKFKLFQIKEFLKIRIYLRKKN